MGMIQIKIKEESEPIKIQIKEQTENLKISIQESENLKIRLSDLDNIGILEVQPLISAEYQGKEHPWLTT